MQIIGLTKIKNESLIIKDTLDHWGSFCTGGIYIYDDKSEDDTVGICKNHSSVKEIYENKIWDYNRERHEWQSRQDVLNMAMKNADKNDWFVYFDADERLFFDEWNLLFNEDLSGISCRLYDVYITPEDKNEKNYNKRNWVGPEFRTILFFFRYSRYLRYHLPDQRMVTMEPGSKIAVSGIIKHFGKGISIEHWDETCKYYRDFFPKYSEKWEKRIGKAVKKDYKSDFGNKLIKFNDILSGREEGFSLEQQSYGLN